MGEDPQRCLRAVGHQDLGAKAPSSRRLASWSSIPTIRRLSESASKVQEQDVVIANALGLKINPAKELPDIILVDLGAPGSKVLVVFVEVVATDGPINEKRKP